MRTMLDYCADYSAVKRAGQLAGPTLPPSQHSAMQLEAKYLYMMSCHPCSICIFPLHSNKTGLSLYPLMWTADWQLSLQSLCGCSVKLRGTDGIEARTAFTAGRYSETANNWVLAVKWNTDIEKWSVHCSTARERVHRLSWPEPSAGLGNSCYNFTHFPSISDERGNTALLPVFLPAKLTNVGQKLKEWPRFLILNLTWVPPCLVTVCSVLK